MTLRIARTDDIDACLALRFTVFVEEQGVPEELERDAYDEFAIHLLAARDGAPLGTARILRKDDIGKIGRVCVLPEARGTGLGAALIRAALEEMRAEGGFAKAALGAQVTAIRFYEKLGFAAYGPEFDDAGIPHRMMERPL